MSWKLKESFDSVPEPASLWLMLTGMLSIAGAMKLPRRRAPR